jgi:hypothetical protein
MHPVLRSGSRIVVLLFLLIAEGCQKNPSSEIDAGAPSATSDAGLNPPAERLVLTLRHQLSDGGMEVVSFDGGVSPEIEPTRFLELTTNFSIHNYRIRVFDELDRALVSDDLATEGDTNLQYQIRFPNLLQRGHRYTLLIDAQTGESVLDRQGRPQPEQRLEFQVAGPREKAPPASKVKKRKRRRHTQMLDQRLPFASKSSAQSYRLYSTRKRSASKSKSRP